MYGAPEWVLDDEMLTIRPQPASSMSGSTAWTAVEDAVEVDVDDPLPAVEVGRGTS